MVDALFIPEEAVEDAQPVIEYPAGYAFDFRTGEFVLSAGGPQLLSDGHRAWVAWCEKALHTVRGAYLVYGPDYGLGLTEVSGIRSEMELLIETAVREALIADPRTGTVEEFTFTWNGDRVDVTCTATPTIGTPATLEVTVGAP